MYLCAVKKGDFTPETSLPFLQRNISEVCEFFTILCMINGQVYINEAQLTHTNSPFYQL